MGRAITYMTVIAGLVLLFYFAGLLQECNAGVCTGQTPSSTLLDLMLNPGSISLSAFSSKGLNVFLGVVAGGAITLGAVYLGKPELALVGPFASYVWFLSQDFLFVFRRLAHENPVFALLFISPPFVLMFVTFIDFLRKGDT